MGMKMKLSCHESLLCALVADSPMTDRALAAERLRRELGDLRAFELAEKNQVAPHMAHALAEAGEHAELPGRWREAHERTHKRISAYMAEMDEVASRLSEAGIRMVALKNAGIARGIYDCPGCCPMGDLDVLVEKSDFRRAHGVMLGAGYNFEFRSPLEEAELEAAEAGGGAEYWKMLADGEKLWFELQWRPVAGRWIRPDQEPTAEELMARSVPIEGTAARLLSPEDNLLQVSLHTAKHTYVRAPGFRLHTDVDRIVRRRPIDWDLFLSRAEKLQVKTAVYFSLLIPRLILGAPVPDEALERLKPSPWKRELVMRWIARAGLFNPDERKFGRAGFVLFTSLMYDDFGGFWRGIFPDPEWMRERYGFKKRWLLPYYHARRVVNLAARRVGT
ncbi:MAG TPA: nucleotidyltransferase family protein [Blastocatellia bacterium]|nr:nucleotidyltransferase family protein [Blastocatellia bacterium]